jgi:hypothetical protein
MPKPQAPSTPEPAPPSRLRLALLIGGIALVLLLALGIAAYFANQARIGQASPTQTVLAATQAARTFHAAGFKLTIPDGWEYFDPQKLGSYVQTINSGGDIPLAAWIPEKGAALVVTRMPWVEGATLEQFVDALAPIAEGQMGAGDIRKAVAIDGQPAIRRDVILPGRSAEEKVRVVQIFLIPSGVLPQRVYIIQVSAPFDLFTAQQAAIEAAIESINFDRE